MTYIEFFSKELVENICACLVHIPQRIIFIGSDRKKMEKYAQRYHQIFLDRGYDLELICKSVNRNQLIDIVNLLSEIVEEYDDCIFDLTGGDELMLAATGIVYERYKDKNIQLQKINLINNIIYDCDADGNIISSDNSSFLSVDENIFMFGGKVVYEEEKYEGTYRWDWNTEFVNDIRTMWNICKKNVRAWNIQISNLVSITSKNTRSEDPLFVETEISDISNYISGYNNKNNILNELQKHGLINIKKTEHISTLTYKNEQIKRCLTKSGQVLEMYITLMALLAKDKDGEKIYNDVKNGVYIDWDGVVHTGINSFDTGNEIDVLMMRGVIPVFVSCKNGSMDIDELYKLNTVAAKFGGKYTRKVLITTALTDNDRMTEYIKLRSQDMNIRFVSISQNMTDEEIQKIISCLW